MSSIRSSMLASRPTMRAGPGARPALALRKGPLQCGSSIRASGPRLASPPARVQSRGSRTVLRAWPSSQPVESERWATAEFTHGTEIPQPLLGRGNRHRPPRESTLKIERTERLQGSRRRGRGRSSNCRFREVRRSPRTAVGRLPLASVRPGSQRVPGLTRERQWGAQPQPRMQGRFKPLPW